MAWSVPLLRGTAIAAAALILGFPGPSVSRAFGGGGGEAAESEKDLYGALGLLYGATEAEIKTAYRKLSVKYHPDKIPGDEAKAKFAEARDAYEIFTNPETKMLYDIGGMEMVKSHNKGEVERGKDEELQWDVTLEDLYNGANTTLGLERQVVCRGCHTRPDSPRCQGCSRCPSAVKIVHTREHDGLYWSKQPVVFKEMCKQEDVIHNILIERGMRNLDKVTLPMMNDQRPDQLPGSVVIVMKMQRHPIFLRRGEDLFVRIEVSLGEALLGWSRTIEHLDKHTVEVGFQGVTGSTQMLSVKGEGMPLRDDPASFGDLFIKVDILYPKELSRDQQVAIAAAFAMDVPKAEL